MAAMKNILFIILEMTGLNQKPTLLFVKLLLETT